MGRRIDKPLYVAGLAVGCLMLSQAQALAADFTLKVADSFPSGHYIMENMTKVWMKSVSEKTNGRVEFKYFPSQQLGKLKEMLDMVESGIADVAYIPPSSFTDRIPLSGVVELPGLLSSTVQGSVAYTNMMKDFLAEQEFKQYNVVPVMAAVVPPYQIGANRAPIVSNDDFKDLRLRTPGGTLELVADAVGALAIRMSGPSTYTAYQRGTVDATLHSPLSMQSYKLFEVTKSVSSNGSFGTFGLIYVVNGDTWAKLPADIQKVMMDEGAAVAKSFAQWEDEQDRKVLEEFKAKGLTIYDIPADVWADWQNKLDTVTVRWAQRLDERGLPGTETVAKWKAAVAAAK